MGAQPFFFVFLNRRWGEEPRKGEETAESLPSRSRGAGSGVGQGRGLNSIYNFNTTDVIKTVKKCYH